MSFGEDFKKFILRGNVVDMAVGIIIGAAFSKIVSSLVADVIMPPIGLIIGKVDFSKLAVVLKPGIPAVPASGSSPAIPAVEAVSIRYGQFLTETISFIIIAFTVFMMIRMLTAVEKALESRAGKTPPPPGEPTEKACPECLSMIPIKATRCSHCCTPLSK